MQTSLLDHYRVNLHILSPIHVGSGQEMDPFGYFIKEQNLFLIDLIKWIEEYPDKENLQKIVDTDSFVEIRTLIAQNIDAEKYSFGRIPIESQGLLSTYKKVIETKDPRNQLLIDSMTRNEISQDAFIPGSSIKGAIRTAIANHFVKTVGVTSKNKSKSNKPFEPDYNEKIFGKINNDPMRNLKLSDVTLSKFGTIIIEAIEHPLQEDKNKTPKGYKEVSVNLCQSVKSIVYPLRFSLKPFNLHNEKVDLTFIINALHSFYLSKYKEEYIKFYSFFT
jgi:CRISPR type III-A-associated RAMP protein Csm5